MNKFLYLILGVVLCMASCSPKPQGQVQDAGVDKKGVQCELSEEGCLRVSGVGVLKREMVDAVLRNSRCDVSKIVVEDGISGIEGNAFFNDRCEYTVEEVEVAGTVSFLPNELFSDCELLKKVALSDGIQGIGERCFIYCPQLREVCFPDSVTYMGNDVFEQCELLEKVVLPRNLQNDVRLYSERHECAALKTVVNRSSRTVFIKDDTGCKTWYVGKKKVVKVPPGKTAKAKRKQIALRYNLRGGRATGELPASYEYGTVLELPMDRVEREGYVFCGWERKYAYHFLDTYTEDSDVATVGPGHWNVTLIALWRQFRLKNVGNGTVRVETSEKPSGYIYGQGVIRYSKNKDMSDAKEVYPAAYDIEKEVHIFKVKNLTKGERYYFQMLFYDIDEEDDEDFPESRWLYPKLSIRVE